MKRHPVFHALARYLIIIISVTATASLFLFLPVDHAPVQKTGYNYYSSLIGTAADPQESFVTERADLPSVQLNKVQYSVQAEYMKLPDCAKISKQRSGYQGNGYVADLPESTENALVFPIHIPFSQHYAVTICAATAKTAVNAIRVNDELLSEFTMIGDSRFTLVTFYGIFLEEGDAKIAIDTIDGGIEVDFIRLHEDYSLYKQMFRITDTPCNPQASAKTVDLYQILAAEWDHAMISGQYVSDNNN